MPPKYGPRNIHRPGEPVFVDASVVEEAEQWRIGDRFTLRYVNHRFFRHRFWSDYPGSPDSELVTANDLHIPLDSTFCIESLVTAYNLRHQCWYIAAKTQHGVWTNIQMGDEWWAVPAREPPSPAPTSFDSHAVRRR